MRQRARKGFTLVLTFTSMLLAGPPKTGRSAELIFDGAIIDRANAWDAYPTIHFINGVHHIWWCSTSPVTSGDGIFLATKATSLGPGGWTIVGEVMNHTHSPIAQNHVCDPTLVRGNFSYASNQYQYALYYTFDAVPPGDGTDASVAVAFSNNGTSFTYHSESVILPDLGFTDFYGAGASSACWGPNVGVLNHFYNDSSYRTDGLTEPRYKSSTDGVLFSPTPSLPTSIALGFTTENFAGSPDLAYSPPLRSWFASTSRLDNFEFEILLIATAGDGASDDAEWTELGRIGTAMTGQNASVESGLARFSDSSLYIDREGYAYVIFGAGDRPFGTEGGAFTWKLYQVRFRVMQEPPLVLDTFQHFGVFRQPNGQLSGTQTELGQRTWQADATLVFDSATGKVSNSSGTGSHVGAIPFTTAEEPSQPATLEALLVRGSDSWSGVGLAGSSSGGLFSTGGLWVLIQDSINQYEIYGNGLNQIALGSVPNLNPDLNFVRLEYHQTTNRLSVAINGASVLESHQLNFSPAISHAGVHIASPVGGGSIGETGVRSIRLNGAPYNLFFDGFETGDALRWSVVDPVW